MEDELSLRILYGDLGEIGSRRLDLLLTLRDATQAIIELKAVQTLTPTHLSQLEYYLAHWKLDTGYLVNFPHETGFPADHACVFRAEALQGADVKDKEVCSAMTIPNESLIVNGTSKGIQNVFVYLEKSPAGATPVPPPASQVFDQVGC